MHIALGLVVLVATVIAVTAVCKRYDLSSPLVLIVVGIVASYLPFVPEVTLRARGRAGRAAAAAALRGVAEHLARRLQRQPAPDPAAVGGPGRGHHPGGRRGRALAGAGPVLGALASRSAPSSPRRTPSRRPRSGAGSACRAGSSRSSRASRCSTTPPRWWRCAPPCASTVAYQVLARDFVVAAGGGVLVGLGGVRGRRQGAPPADRPAAGQRPVVHHPVRGVRRGGGDPRQRRDRGRGRRPPARPQGPDPADRAVADRRSG